MLPLDLSREIHATDVPNYPEVPVTLSGYDFTVRRVLTADHFALFNTLAQAGFESQALALVIDDAPRVTELVDGLPPIESVEAATRILFVAGLLPGQVIA